MHLRGSMQIIETHLITFPIAILVLSVNVCKLQQDYLGDPERADENEDDELFQDTLDDVDTTNAEPKVKHCTVLRTIKDLDLVCDIPLDYLHLVCIGIGKRLIQIWLDNGLLKVKSVSTRSKKYENIARMNFKKNPESLEEVKRWKATQFRQFLLYIGVPVLQDLIDGKYPCNFLYLVVAMRAMTCMMQEDPEKQSSECKRRHLPSLVHFKHV